MRLGLAFICFLLLASSFLALDPLLPDLVCNVLSGCALCRLETSLALDPYRERALEIAQYRALSSYATGIDTLLEDVRLLLF